MLAFINTDTYEVRTAQTGADKDRLTLVTSPQDLAKKFSLGQLRQLADKLGSTPVPGKVAKDKVAPKLWRDLVAEAERVLHAEPEDLSDLPAREPNPMLAQELAPEMGPTVYPNTFVPAADPVSTPTSRAVTREPGGRPRLKGLQLHNVQVDLTSLPPQAALIAQGLLREAAQGTTHMDPDQLEAFLTRLNLRTKQEPWRIFRYYHRNLELLGVISAEKGGE